MEEKRRDSTGTPPPHSATSEAPPPEQPTSRRRGGGQKRKLTSISSGGGSSNPSSSSKRQAREKPPAVPFPQIHMNGPLTRARLQPTSSNSFYQAEVSVKSEVEAQEAAKKADEISRAIQNWEALEAKIEAEYESIKTRDASVHVVPVHAGWFSWKKIHPLEKRMLPSFFNEKSDKRNPEMYMEIRNWIMKKFHLDPSVNIELKHLSELTVGESDARTEVMEFLDYWGLINYHPFPQNEPAVMNADTAPDKTLKTDSLVEKLFKFETVQSWSPVIPRMNTAMPATPSGLFPESVVADELVKSEGPSVEYHCNSCSADCSRKRYHCQKQADFDLCAECFNDGKFGSNMSPSDFILMEPPEAGGASGGNWTDQETILLLEAIELFRDNWSEIAEHVATKTKAQCILHFIQMPIEDAFLNHDNENNAAPEENGLPDSISNEDSSTKVDQDRDVALNDVSEQKESAIDHHMEVSKADDVSESDNSHEVTDSLALKALKEAFEAVGALPSPGERLSFAEVGNPVMALAAFLVRLVEPNITTASARILLKSLSSNHPGSLLAARHCFRLEDPPNEEESSDNSEGAPTEKNELEAKKHDEEHVQKENGDTCDPLVDKSSTQDDCNDKNKESATEEHEENKESASVDQKLIVPNSECADKSDCVKESDGIATGGAQPTSISEPSSSDITKDGMSKVAEESVFLESHTELQPDIVKEQKDGASAEEHSEVKDPLKNEDMLSNSEEKETEALVVSNSIKEKERDTGVTKDKESGSENKETMATINDPEIDKLQRVAVTALSAAAVKAKLLADHEEDQIRQLATFLIDKQLHKLEAKLAFFNDMENVASRVKEQLDRSKQRLFHERAQIIATRFGMSASARPNSQTVPIPNRTASAILPNSNQGPGHFTGMNTMRPPVSRPVMAPNSKSSNFVSATATGTSAQSSYSVGTK